LPASSGTQKLWITSPATTSSRTGRPTGTWTSFAVVATIRPGDRSRYWICHHHCRPVMRTVSSGCVAGAATADWVAIENTNTATRITTGTRIPPITIHRSPLPVRATGARVRVPRRTTPTSTSTDTTSTTASEMMIRTQPSVASRSPMGPKVRR